MQLQYTAGLGLALAASAAMAQPDSSAPTAALPPSQSFVTLDANGDGALSRSELWTVPELHQGFETKDRNKDGTLSMGEFAIPPAPTPNRPREAPEPPTWE